jgi:hypothetical protein
MSRLTVCVHKTYETETAKESNGWGWSILRGARTIATSITTYASQRSAIRYAESLAQEIGAIFAIEKE